MIQEIGENAGIIWNYLDENGEVTIRELAKATGLKKRHVHRAIGWLAREGKVTITTELDSEFVCLSRNLVIE